MAFQTIKYEKEDRVVTITLNRPEKLNAINSDCLKELNEACDTIESDQKAWVVILTGGERNFSVGGDISLISSLTSPQKQFDFSRQFQQLVQKVANLDRPVIAAVCGFALGGGCELALACDLRIASETARFGLPEINLGSHPAGGGTQMLPRLIGKTKAKEILFTGLPVDAQEAYRIGMVNKVVANNMVINEAKAVAMIIAEKPRLSMSAIKRLINKGTSMEMEAALLYEAESLKSLSSTEDFKEGTTSFMQKRKPNFQGM